MNEEDFLEAEEDFRIAMRDFLSACIDFDGVESIEDKILDIYEQEKDNV